MGQISRATAPLVPMDWSAHPDPSRPAGRRVLATHRAEMLMAAEGVRAPERDARGDPLVEFSPERGGAEGNRHPGHRKGRPGAAAAARNHREARRR